jgi:putative membrane protein insertion efficiency factor
MSYRWITGLLKLPVLMYRYGISPLIPPRCRYVPTCSEYAIEALDIHGPAKGSLLAAGRICRCHPWGGSGYDPVPPACNDKATPQTSHQGTT